MDLFTAVEIAVGIVMTAKAICALTPTPAPGTLLGRLYRGIEIAALLVGRAKDTGLVPANPVVDRVGADMVRLAKDAIGKTAVALVVAGGAGTALVACSAQQLSATEAKVQSVSTAVQAACADVQPLLSLAAMIPAANTVAAGVQVGCNTATGLAKLASDPTSAEWLGIQAEKLRTIAAGAGIKIGGGDSIKPRHYQIG